MKKLREKCKNKKGFTMVELIVVIVIILVLAAVLVPSLLKYVDKANQANIKADAATLMSQVQADTASSLSDGGTPAAITIGEVTASPVPAITINAKGAKAAQFVCDTTAGSKTYGDITAFAYRDTKHWVTWTNTGGWKIDGK